MSDSACERAILACVRRDGGVDTAQARHLGLVYADTAALDRLEENGILKHDGWRWVPALDAMSFDLIGVVDE